MISLDEIEQSILELEQKDTCFSVCEKLAQLYIVRDHLKNNTPQMLSVNGESEFLQIIDGKSTEKVWNLIDEMVSAVKLLHPKMYDKFIMDIQDIK